MELASQPTPKLTLAPGDVLDIKFYYAPELNESQAVRPDGKIFLQFDIPHPITALEAMSQIAMSFFLTVDCGPSTVD
jgi:hypothetical protein